MGGLAACRGFLPELVDVVVLGAVPAPLHRPGPEEPYEMIRRAGWLTITERRDVLAHRVADFAQSWNEGADWHTGAVKELHPDTCSTAREWAARLTRVPRDQPPPSWRNSSSTTGTPLSMTCCSTTPSPAPQCCAVSPGPGAPACSPSTSSVCPPSLGWPPSPSTQHRLGAHRRRHSLARPRTRRLRHWPRYSGTGCLALARLVDALLDDIFAPAEAPRGPFTLLSNSGDTTYTRAQLIAARTRTGRV